MSDGSSHESSASSEGADSSDFEHDTPTIQKELAQALEQLNPNFNFAYSGRIPTAPNPGLCVDELGIFGLPLSSREAQVLISKCRKSPVGKGSETLLDDTVRKSWELNASQFQIQNEAEWNAFMRGLILKIHQQLGLTGPVDDTKAELYKLLIYEKGAFFKPHQDTEKTQGMFGTLAVSLPSAHSGGEVVLTHNKKEHRYESAIASDTVLGSSFGIWYSDIYHEVKPVTSGYRVVLIYNLVQRFVMNQPRPPGKSTEPSIRRCLSDWSRSCAAGDTDLPYAIHTLDHVYTEDALRLDALKGKDIAQVSCLQKYCSQLGFDIYFAMYEKVIHKDDEAGDEEFDREESFKCLKRLDGSIVQAQPDFDKSYFLREAEDTDEEDHDESEHQGYTGNEGAPAQYWYRKTCVIMVPPSRKLAFILTGDNKYQTILRDLPAVRRKAASDESAVQVLREYIAVVLTSDPAPRFSYRYYGLENDSQHKACLEQVADISLEYGWIEIFDKVPLEQKKATCVLQAMGRYIATTENALSDMRFEIPRILNGHNISEKYRMWQSVALGFQNASPSHEKQDIFNAWRSETFQKIVQPNGNYVRADCVALFSLAESSDEAMLEAILTGLKERDIVAFAVFVVEISRSSHSLDNLKKIRSSKDVLETIWTNFSFMFKPNPVEQKPSAPRYDTYTPYGIMPYRGSTRYNAIEESKPKINDDGLTHQDLSALIGLTGKESDNLLHMALSAMGEVIQNVTPDYMVNHLLSFIQAILGRKLEAIVPENNLEVSAQVSELIFAALSLYIRQTVPREPAQPTNWTKPYRGCGCSDCKSVDVFMADPRQTRFELRGVEQRRKHLRQIYEDVVMRSQERDYDVHTSKHGSPHTWVCVKNHKGYKKAFDNWQTKQKEARHILNMVAGRDHSTLQAYLGHNYKDIASCRSENLPVREVQGNSGLAEMTESSLNSRKRKADYGGNDLDEAHTRAKRQRDTLEQAVHATEVVDLT